MRSYRFAVSCFVVVAAGFLATPVIAQEPNGFPITNVNLRAGPGTQYPVIVTVPAEAPITILGCLPDYTWCDTVFHDSRGWMSSIYLSGYYEGSYYSLGDYAPRLGYQTVTFDVEAYWDAYYRDEPFYGERTRWGGPRDIGYVDDAVFYDRLSPHGQWTWIQGRYVWVPGGVDRAWRPYTRGRWVYTEQGWMWVSNEPFGWATYHYGRWGFSDRIGWFWVPGNRWAPAWVSWRQSDDYLAWAPLPPSHDDGINITISFGSVPNYYWQVVPSADFLADDLPRHVLYDRDRWRPALERTRPIGHTTIINNKTVVNKVVNVKYVEQKTNKKVVKRKVVKKADEAQQIAKVENDVVEVYEPKPDEKPAKLAPPEPKEVEEVAKASETKEQAEGEATTEEMLAPPEVKEAVTQRKGKGRKGKTAEAKADLDPSLPKGGEADAPPPLADAPKPKPVPAEDLTPPAADKGEKAATEPKPKEAPATAKETTPDETPPPAAADTEAKPRPESKKATAAGAKDKPGGKKSKTSEKKAGGKKSAAPEGEEAAPAEDTGSIPSVEEPAAAAPPVEETPPQAKPEAPPAPAKPAEMKPEPVEPDAKQEAEGEPEQPAGAAKGPAALQDEAAPEPKAKAKVERSKKPPRDKPKAEKPQGPPEAKSKKQGAKDQKLDDKAAAKKAPPKPKEAGGQGAELKQRPKPEEPKAPAEAKAKQGGKKAEAKDKRAENSKGKPDKGQN
ncbi:MAG: DUF6600 domain-containing protein [Methyloceanibacter sp.]|uniref:DUF6600 domain-containing protein n=1 Tax=Methyloceanibacter sp. TaxID=1965321 RepID=UPI003D6CCF84